MQATSILKALGEIAKKFDIDLAQDAENSDLAEDTPVEHIARDLRSQKDEASAEEN
jgi:phosphate uptake regulator